MNCFDVRSNVWTGDSHSFTSIMSCLQVLLSVNFSRMLMLFGLLCASLYGFCCGTEQCMSVTEQCVAVTGNVRQLQCVQVLCVSVIETKSPFKAWVELLLKGTVKGSISQCRLDWVKSPSWFSYALCVYYICAYLTYLKHMCIEKPPYLVGILMSIRVCCTCTCSHFLVHMHFPYVCTVYFWLLDMLQFS